MEEGFTISFALDWEVFSAGIAPYETVNPNAISAVAKIDIGHKQKRSKEC